jgi:hypothetical protein
VNSRTPSVITCSGPERERRSLLSTAISLWREPWISKIIDLVSERAGNYQRKPRLGVLLDQLWVE